MAGQALQGGRRGKRVIQRYGDVRTDIQRNGRLQQRVGKNSTKTGEKQRHKVPHSAHCSTTFRKGQLLLISRSMTIYRAKTQASPPCYRIVGNQILYMALLRFIS